MKNKLFVGSLSWDTTDEGLQAAFAQAGTVVSARVIRDRYTDRSRGFGFVEMENDEQAQAAIDMWHEKELDGRKIIVSIAQPKKEA